MKIVEKYEFDCPEWAVVALEYNDCSGLSTEDTHAIDRFDIILQEMKEDIQADNYVIGYDFDNRNEFNPSPEFGLTCSTVPALVTFLK